LFLLACHCIAHRTNLAALNVVNTPDCKVLSTKIDVLINSISIFFHKSSKRKHGLTTLQEQLFDSKKTMKRYHKIRWLSSGRQSVPFVIHLNLSLFVFKRLMIVKHLLQSLFWKNWVSSSIFVSYTFWLSFFNRSLWYQSYFN